MKKQFKNISRKINNSKGSNFLYLGIGFLVLAYLFKGFFTSLFNSLSSATGLGQDEKQTELPEEEKESNFNRKKPTHDDLKAIKVANLLYTQMSGIENKLFFNPEKIIDILIENQSILDRVYDAFGLKDYAHFGDEFLNLGQWLNKFLSDYWDYDKGEFQNDESYLEVAEILFKRKGIQI